MTTILFSAAASNPDLLAGFNPSTDVLLFDAVDPTAVKLAATATQTTFSVGDQSVTLDVQLASITSGTSGFVRFVAGGGLFIGDGTSSTVADSLANNLSTLATDNADQLRGLDGNDTLNGGKGADLIYGNAGNDSIIGTTGDTSVDTVFGGQGNDTIGYSAVDASVYIYGNLGDDLLGGSNNHDNVIFAGQGSDTVIGGAQDDRIYGNAGDDSMHGFGGHNTIFGGQGNDSIYSGSGDSSVTYGNLGDDSIISSGGGDTLFGGQGVDTLYGLAGNDLMLGNLDGDLLLVIDNGGQDTLVGGAGNDTFNIDISTSGNHRINDFVHAEDQIVLHGVTALDLAQNAVLGGVDNPDSRANLLSGADIILNGDFGSVSVMGGSGQTLTGTNLVLDGGDVFAYNVGGVATQLDGSANSDVLVAGDNGDTLVSGGGADTVIGGDGNDLIDLEGNTSMGVVMYGGNGDDVLHVDVNNGTNMTITETGIEHLNYDWTGGVGTAFTYLATTDSGIVTVDASGFAANEELFFQVVASNGVVNVTTGTGDDVILGSATTSAGDTITSGDGNDQLFGFNGNDVLNGGLGTDQLIGGGGADTLTGGSGVDEFEFNVGDSGTTVATVDVITDFAAGTDQIDFLGAAAITAVLDQRLLAIASGTDLGTAANAAFTAAGAVANQAVLFNVDSHTYVYVNDTTAGFSTSDDLIVDITGFTGTLTTADFI